MVVFIECMFVRRIEAQEQSSTPAIFIYFCHTKCNCAQTRKSYCILGHCNELLVPFEKILQQCEQVFKQSKAK